MPPFRSRRPVWVIGGLALVGLLIAGAFILRPSDARAIYRTAAVEQAMGESGRLVTRVPTAALGWTPTDARSPSRFYSAARSSGGPGPRGSPSAQVAEVLDLDAAQQRVWKDLSLDLRRQITLLAAQAHGDRAAAIEGVVRATHEAFAKLEPSLRTDQKQKLASLRASMAAVALLQRTRGPRGTDRRQGAGIGRGLHLHLLPGPFVKERQPLLALFRSDD